MKLTEASFSFFLTIKIKVTLKLQIKKFFEFFEFFSQKSISPTFT